MNPTRRTMLESIQSPTVSPEVLAIIKQGSPQSQVHQAQSPAIATLAVKPEATPLPKPAPETPRPTKPKAEKERGGETVTLISVNYRLPATISPLLLRASSERKLKKLYPYTQQDIVAEALSDWLKKHGYQT